MKTNRHTLIELSFLSEMEELRIYGGKSVKKKSTDHGCTVHERDCVVYQQCNLPESSWKYKKITKDINKI